MSEPYTKERLIKENSNYNYEHRVTDRDVETVNALIQEVEAERQIDPPVPMAGDIVICVNPDKGTVSEHGHLEHDSTLGWTICVHPSTPFLLRFQDGTRYFSTSGGYWRNAEKKLDQFVFKGKRQKTFCTWGHVGRCAHGAVDFRAEVFVWEFTDPYFY